MGKWKNGQIKCYGIKSECISLKKVMFATVFCLILALGLSRGVQAVSPSINPSSPALSNSIIDVGQITIVNTIISGGAGAPYNGQYTWAAFNLTGAVTNTIQDNTVVFSDFYDNIYHPPVLAINPQGSKLYAIVNNYTQGGGYGVEYIEAISTSTNSIVNTIAIPGSQNFVTHIVINSQGTVLYGLMGQAGSPCGLVVGDCGNTIARFDLTTNSLVGTTSVPSCIVTICTTNPYAMALSPSGADLYIITENAVNSNWASNIQVFNTLNNNFVGSIPLPLNTSLATTMAINKNGIGYAVTVNQLGLSPPNMSVIVFNTNTNQVINTITVPGSQNYLLRTAEAFSKNGSLLYVSGAGPGMVVINTATNAIIGRDAAYIPSQIAPEDVLNFNSGRGNAIVNNQISSITIDPTGTLAYIGAFGLSGTSPSPFDSDFTVYIFDLLTNKTIGNIRAPSTGFVNYNPAFLDPVSQFVLNPNGKIGYIGQDTELDVASLPLLNTTIQNLPSIQTSNALGQIEINAISNTLLSITLNGISYQASGPNTNVTYNSFISLGGYPPTHFYIYGTPSNQYVYGNYTIHFIGTDSSGFNVMGTNSLIINPQLTMGNFVENGLYNGQLQILTANVIGGTSPYTYNYQVFNSMGDLVYNGLLKAVTSSSNTFVYRQMSAWGTGTFTVNVIISDSATTPETVFSNSLTYTPTGNVIPNLTVTLSPSSNALIIGNTLTFTIGINGGVSPYTINFFNITGSTVIANVVYPAPWANLVDAFPSQYAYGSCITYNNKIYCIGGSNSRNGFSNSTYYAPVLSSGSTGTWSTNIPYSNYTFEIAGQSCVLYNNTAFSINNIYCMAGSSDGPILFGDLNSTAFAPILSDGSVGNWVNATNETINLEGQSCISYSNTLFTINNIYCVGGSAEGAYVSPSYAAVNMVDYVPIFPSNGMLGNWINDSNHYPFNITYGSCLLNSNNIYCIGGEITETSSAFRIGLSTNAVYYAPILSNGLVGTWHSASDYPFNVSAQSCINSNSVIFCTGGFNDSNDDINATYYSQINPDGTLGNWVATYNGPELAHYNNPSDGSSWTEGQSCVTLSNNIYCFGGAFSNYPPTVGDASSLSQNITYAHLSNNGITNTLPTFSFVVNAAVTTGFQYNLTVNDSGLQITNSLTQGIEVCTSSPCASTSSTTSSTTTTSTSTIGSGLSVVLVSNSVADTNQVVTLTAVLNSVIPPIKNITFWNVTGNKQASPVNYLPWKSTANYPMNISAVSCTSYNNNIYCVGGVKGEDISSSNTAATFHASIKPDNSLASWIPSTNYPANVFDPYCLTYSNNIYCAGGDFSGVQRSLIYYAPILADNSLGVWTSATSFPLSVGYYHGIDCVTFSTNLYCMGSSQGSGNYLYYAPILSDGSLGSWSFTQNTYPLHSLSGAPGCTIASNNIYCVGDSNQISSTIGNNTYYAPILPSNIVGTWVSSPRFAGLLHDTSCFTNHNDIYCFGDWWNSTFYTQIFSSGQPGNWIPSNSIPFLPSSTNPAGFAMSGNTFYLIGGGRVGGLTPGANSAVLYARITNSEPFNSLTGSFVAGGYGYMGGVSNTYQYNVIINDSTPSTVNSIANSVNVVDSGFNGGNLFGTNNIYADAGQYENITATGFQGGVGPFSINYIIFNSITGKNLTNQFYNGLSFAQVTFNSFVWQIPLDYAGNTINVTAYITDYGTTSPAIFSYGRTSPGYSCNLGLSICNLTINPALQPILVPSNSALDSGQTETFTVNLTALGGTTPYTINFFNVSGNTLLTSIHYPSWFNGTAYPSGSGFGGCLTYSNNIYCVGGVNSSFDGSNVTYYAPILPNNAIGSWTATSNSPFGAAGQSCTLYSNNIYCIGGIDVGPPWFSFLDLNETAFAPILSNGIVGTWVNTTNQTVSMEGQSCLSYSNTPFSINNIYCIGGYSLASPGRTGPFYSGMNIVDYVPIFPSNGMIGNWVNNTNNFPLNVSYGSCVLNTNNIYCIGGVFANVIEVNAGRITAYTNSVYYAPILSDGSVGNWIDQPNYPANIADESCVVTSNTIYCTGGDVYTHSGAGCGSPFPQGCGDTNTSYYAPILAGGSLGNWVSTKDQVRSVGSNGDGYTEGENCFAYNKNIYCIGGIENGGAPFGWSGTPTNIVNYIALANNGFTIPLPSYSFTVNSAVNTIFQYNIIVTDSANTPANANSITENILVCPSGPCITTSTTSIASTTSTSTASTTSTSTISVTTTTISGGGGGGTGGGGGGGGGSPSGPTVTKLNATCDLISNMSVLNSVSFTVNGANHTVVDNYISSNFTSVIVNGITYVLTLGARQTIPSLSLSLLLQSVSYAPILHTVNVIACSTSPATTATTTTVTTSTYIPTKSTTSTSTTATTTKCQGNGSKACRGSSTTATTTIIPNVTTHLDYFIPITIYNYQNASTVHNFDQMIVINSSKYSQYEAANLQNIVFYYQNKTIIPSWLEMNNTSSSRSTTYWVKLAEQIPAHSNITIYMGFANKTSVLFNPTTTGEAPQLTNNYAQYDDGKNVFPLYDNFAGKKLSSLWKKIGTGKYKVSNGLSLPATK